ncbi:MAG: 50S ribosomal protein L4 [Patescibacteria group bacterium]|jgi:large subunit ribosomal protein L4
MPSVAVYNNEGSKVSEVKLREDIFDVKVNPSLIQQAVVTQQANSRHPFAHTKTRGEVRGGGRKPWAQKGTGRARHGSIRSPIWKGGGVAFGPRKTRNYTKQINAKAKRKALFMVLSEKVRDNEFVVIDQLKFEKPKTKDIVGLMKKLPVKKNVLLILPVNQPMIYKSARNLPSTQVILADSLNVVDVLRAHTLVMPQSAVEVIEKTYRRST